MVSLGEDAQRCSVVSCWVEKSLIATSLECKDRTHSKLESIKFEVNVDIATASLLYAVLLISKYNISIDYICILVLIMSLSEFSLD